MEKTKICRRCNETKSLSEFHSDRSRADGRYPYCKDCACAYKRADNVKHQEKRRDQKREDWAQKGDQWNEKRRAKYASDVAYQESVRERNRQNYRKNPQKMKDYVAAWSKANREKMRVYRRKMRARNPDPDRDYAQRRRAWRKGVPVKAVSRAVVFARDRGICHVCHLPADPDNWHLDHVIPLSLGGEHSYTNVSVAHPFCNLSRGNRIDHG